MSHIVLLPGSISAIPRPTASGSDLRDGQGVPGNVAASERDDVGTLANPCMVTNCESAPWLFALEPLNAFGRDLSLVLIRVIHACRFSQHLSGRNNRKHTASLRPAFRCRPSSCAHAGAGSLVQQPETHSRDPHPHQTSRRPPTDPSYLRYTSSFRCRCVRLQCRTRRQGELRTRRGGVGRLEHVSFCFLSLPLLSARHHLALHLAVGTLSLASRLKRAAQLQGPSMPASTNDGPAHAVF